MFGKRSRRENRGRLQFEFLMKKTSPYRRAFLLSSLAFGSSFFLVPRRMCAQKNENDRLPAADMKKIDLDTFSDFDLDLPYYVAHFHELANSVIMEGKDKGFISLPVWRQKKDCKPYNARVMENILSLAYFYVTDRPWNPYRNDPRLKARLEAALAFWCRSSKKGLFSEYSATNYNLAATAFATKFMGETLALLSLPGTDIDLELLKQVGRTDRKAIATVLTDSVLIDHGKVYSNQYTNAFAGGLAYLELFPEIPLRKLLLEKITSLSSEMQSPAGFFYERNGPDWSYNLGTHHSNMRMCWFYSRNTELGDFFLEEERRFIDWFAHNAVLEPTGRQGFVLNKQIETRQSVGFWNGYNVVNGGVQSLFLLPSTPLAGAFLNSQEQAASWQKRARSVLEKNWPDIPPLKEGFSAFTPYTFLHRRHCPDLPDEEGKKEGFRLLPYIKTNRFTQQSSDSRLRLCYTFVRRPGYYLVFNSGEISGINLKSYRYRHQFLGLGILWMPGHGAILQSQRENGLSWGTRPKGSESVIESGNFFPEFIFEKTKMDPQIGVHELPGNDLSIGYGCGRGGKKSLVCLDKKIEISIESPGEFTEFIPLLVSPAHSVIFDKSRSVLKIGTIPVQIDFYGATKSGIRETGEKVGEKRLLMLQLDASDRLKYSFDFDPPRLGKT